MKRILIYLAILFASVGCSQKEGPTVSRISEAVVSQDVGILTTEPLETTFTLVVTFGAPSVLDGDNYNVTVTASADQYNEGYLPTGITVGMKILDGVGRRFEVTAVNSANLSSADLDVFELQDENQGPSGAGIIHTAYTNYDLIALAPVNSIGISPLTMARALLHNMRVIDSGVEGVSGNEAAFDGWDKNAADDFDGAYSSLTGTPIIPTISDLAYGVSWNTNTDGATKNAIYDQLEILAGDIAAINDHASVTFAGAYDYLTLSGQQITLGLIDLTTDVTGVLPQTNFAVTGNWTGTFDGQEGTYYLDYTNFSNTPSIPTVSDLAYGVAWDANTDAATKNAIYDKIESISVHDAVTLAGTYDYLTLSGQQITRGQIDLTTDVTGLLPQTNFVVTGNWTGTFDGQEGAWYVAWANLTGVPAGFADGTDDERSEEEVEDFVGTMLGGTETGISVTYQDATNDIDFVVDFIAYPGTYNVNSGSTSFTMNWSSYDRVAARVDMTNASTVSTINITFSNPVDGGIYTIWFDDVNASGHNLNFPANVHNLNNTDFDGGTTVEITEGYRITCQYYSSEGVYICQ